MWRFLCNRRLIFAYIGLQFSGHSHIGRKFQFNYLYFVLYSSSWRCLAGVVDRYTTQVEYLPLSSTGGYLMFCLRHWYHVHACRSLLFRCSSAILSSGRMLELDLIFWLLYILILVSTKLSCSLPGCTQVLKKHLALVTSLTDWTVLPNCESRCDFLFYHLLKWLDFAYAKREKRCVAARYVCWKVFTNFRTKMTCELTQTNGQSSWTSHVVT